MVVLDQHGVEQARAVIAAAATAHGVFFQTSPARSGLARVVDLRSRGPATCRTYCRVSVATPESRPTRFSSNRSAVSRSRAGPARVPTGGGRLHRVTVLDVRRPLGGNLHFVQSQCDGSQPADHAALTCHDDRPALRLGLDQRHRRDVHPPIQILAHGQPHQLPTIVLQRLVPDCLMELCRHRVIPPGQWECSS